MIISSSFQKQSPHLNTKFLQFGPMKREAKKLGFEPFAARGFLMPENLVYFYPKSTEIKLIKRAKSQVEVFADEMIEGKAKWFVKVFSLDFWKFFLKKKETIEGQK